MIHHRIKDVLELLDPPKGFEPWHGGPTLLGCLRGLSAKQAAWKPTPERNSVWDLVLHIAYWKYNIIRRLNPDYPNEFKRSPANFPEVPPKATRTRWKEDKKLLGDMHQQLVGQIKKFPPEKLDEWASDRENYTYMQLISGIAAHDTYHIAQIQILKKLYVEMKAESQKT